MKRVRLITTDKHNGKEAISRTPLRNRYFFEGAWQGVKLKKIDDPELSEITGYVHPTILRDAQIIETVEVVYADLSDTFDIRVLIDHVECETPNRVHEATIQRQLCQLRQNGKLNYEVIDSSKGTYRKLPVMSKTCTEQVKMEFQPDWEKRFVKFLKEEGAYENFKANIKNPVLHSQNIPLTLEEVFNSGMTGYLTMSFIWNKSKQGFVYWNKLDYKWRAIYNGKN
jgi:hypothetical protein